MAKNSLGSILTVTELTVRGTSSLVMILLSFVNGACRYYVHVTDVAYVRVYVDYAVDIYWIVRSFLCGTKAYTPPAGLKRADMWRTNLKVG